MTWPLTRDRAAGRSAERKYKELSKAWQRRMFGRWGRLFWPAFVVLFFVAMKLPGQAQIFAVAFVTATGAMWYVMREFAAPDHIQRWQRGARGERWTAKELRSLARQGWVVRHDLPNGQGNRDHVLVGPAVYLLDTKNLEDDLTLEGDALRVRRIEQPRDSYVLDGLTASMRGAAKKLSHEIRQATGERVWVYPVVVLWGRFEAKTAEAGGVCYVSGHHVADWLRSRPNDLHTWRRQLVEDWLRSAEARSRGADSRWD
jgi:hypothetical protein